MHETEYRLRMIYEASLARIERLMDKPRSDADDRDLEILVRFVEAYEDIYYPMGPDALNVATR